MFRRRCHVSAEVSCFRDGVEDDASQLLDGRGFEDLQVIVADLVDVDGVGGELGPAEIVGAPSLGFAGEDDVKRDFVGQRCGGVLAQGV